MPKIQTEMKAASNKKPIGLSAKKTEREILYPEVSVKKCYGEQALSFETVKKLLGWSESPSPELPNEPYLFKDYHGKPIWCHNVITKTYRNRFLTWPNVLALKQEHLRRRWKRNGETISIGKSGFVLNGQHQSIGFCLACQEWNANREDWDTWSSEPTMEKLVVFGIEEDDDTVNSMDTAKPRTLVEVIERSEIFSKLKNTARKECAKMTDHAIRLLWHRLGIKLDAFAPRRTHSEAMDFIGNHSRLLDCVKHIYEENRESKISEVLSPGYAAALMYLMAGSSTPPEKYHDAEIYSEQNIDLENYDKASDFFVLISGQSQEMSPLQAAITSLKRDALDKREARIATLIKAWILFVSNTPLTKEGLKLEFVRDGDIQKLAECPTTGGIDRGNPKDDLSSDEDPTEDEIREHKQAEEAIRQEKTSGKAPKKGKKSQLIEVGDSIFVRDSEDEGNGYWDGELLEIYEAQGKKIGRVKSFGSGKTFDAPLERMSHEEPV